MQRPRNLLLTGEQHLSNLIFVSGSTWPVRSIEDVWSAPGNAASCIAVTGTSPASKPVSLRERDAYAALISTGSTEQESDPGKKGNKNSSKDHIITFNDTNLHNVAFR